MKMTVEEAREKLGGTKVHAVAIQKGGTGKTTITSDICYTLAKMGFKVLAIHRLHCQAYAISRMKQKAYRHYMKCC